MPNLFEHCHGENRRQTESNRARLFCRGAKEEGKSQQMDYKGGFIMQKTVDRSLLNDGMTIPVSACALLRSCMSI